MKELYEAILSATKEAVEREKDKGFSNTTFRMIGQTVKIYQALVTLTPSAPSLLFSPDDKETEQ